MNSQVTTVVFEGAELHVVEHKNVKYVALRPFCETLELSLISQLRRLETNPQFSCSDITTTGIDGKTYKMVCIPLDQLTMWLCSINANKINPQNRERLLLFQRECQLTLTRHFFPQGGTNLELQAFADRFEMKLETEIKSLREDMKYRFSRLQGEVDELRELTGMLMTDEREERVRKLIQEVKTKLNMDGRAIVGHVRKTLNLNSIYDNYATLPQVENVLNNLLGRGVFGVVTEEVGDEET